MNAAALAGNPGFVTLAVMLATIMQGLDTTIANVSLPHMQGSMSATHNQISWVLDLLYCRRRNLDAAHRHHRQSLGANACSCSQ